MGTYLPRLTYAKLAMWAVPYIRSLWAYIHTDDGSDYEVVEWCYTSMFTLASLP